MAMLVKIWLGQSFFYGSVCPVASLWGFYGELSISRRVLDFHWLFCFGKTIMQFGNEKHDQASCVIREMFVSSFIDNGLCFHGTGMARIWF
jgi:hypothetical protein